MIASSSALGTTGPEPFGELGSFRCLSGSKPYGELGHRPDRTADECQSDVFFYVFLSSFLSFFNLSVCLSFFRAPEPMTTVLSGHGEDTNQQFTKSTMETIHNKIGCTCSQRRTTRPTLRPLVFLMARPKFRHAVFPNTPTRGEGF